MDINSICKSFDEGEVLSTGFSIWLLRPPPSALLYSHGWFFLPVNFFDGLSERVRTCNCWLVCFSEVFSCGFHFSLSFFLSFSLIFFVCLIFVGVSSSPISVILATIGSTRYWAIQLNLDKLGWWANNAWASRLETKK